MNGKTKILLVVGIIAGILLWIKSRKEKTVIKMRPVGAEDLRSDMKHNIGSNPIRNSNVANVTNDPVKFAKQNLIMNVRDGRYW